MTPARDPREALRAFAVPHLATECRPVRGGHINETWRAGPWLLQRLNPDVFPEAESIMENVRAVARRLAERPDSRADLGLVPTADGHWWHTASDGAVWRLFRFIAGESLETAPTPAHAEGAARAFGEFTRVMSDPPLPLRVTLPGFHDTRLRLEALAAAAHRDTAGRAVPAARVIDAILAEHELACVIPALLGSGGLPLRVAHNDAKIANVIFAADSATPVAVIDLDTAMPGTPLHDFGDLVRSMVSDSTEDADARSVQVRHDFFTAIVRGFLAGTDGMLTEGERSLLVTAARSIALEQAARFLTDHLAGDRYFAVRVEGQNLQRARTQLALLEGLTRDAEQLESIVALAS